MLDRLAPIVLLAAAPALASPFFSTFEGDAPGSFPGAPWRDIAASDVPAPSQTPTGRVIETVGMDGQATRAFQVFQRTDRSQGIIASIDTAPTHRVEADLRVDIHPTPFHLGDWTAAMGFFMEDDTPIDINARPQGVVYVYRERWYFYGASAPGSDINIELSTAAVLAGAWYHVSLDSDTSTGLFTVRVTDVGGTMLVDRSVSLPDFAPSVGEYNRVAVFDGEISGRPATPGQFTVDNVRYVPAPGVLGVLLGAPLVFSRRR